MRAKRLCVCRLCPVARKLLNFHRTSPCPTLAPGAWIMCVQVHEMTYADVASSLLRTLHERRGQSLAEHGEDLRNQAPT